MTSRIVWSKTFSACRGVQVYGRFHLRLGVVLPPITPHTCQITSTPAQPLTPTHRTPVTHLATPGASCKTVLPTAAMSTSAPDSKGREGGELSVVHDAANQEFVIMLGKDKALLQYEYDPDGQVDLWHTEVPPVFRGHGVAKHLAQAALDHFSNLSTPMRLSCTYLQKYVKDFPQPAYQRFIVSD